MSDMQELRALVRKAINPGRAEHAWYDDPAAVAEERVSAVLTGIDDAGYAMVSRDRYERLRDAAAIYAAELSGRCEGYVGATRQCTSVLEPGDLDPIGGGE